MWFQSKSPDRGTVAKRGIGSLTGAASRPKESAYSAVPGHAQTEVARPAPPAATRSVPPPPPPQEQVRASAPAVAEPATSRDNEDLGPVTVPPPIVVEMPPPPPPPAGAAPRVQRVDRIEDVPHGTLLSGPDGAFPLNDSDRQAFAVIRTDAKSCVTLVSDTHWGTAHMFELRRRLRSELGMEVSEVRADPAVLIIVYERHQPSSKSSRISAGDETAAEKFVWQLIDQSVESHASDIHIESRGVHAEVFLRINGERQRVASISMEQATNLGRVLYTVYAEESSKEAAWDPATIQDSVVEHTTANQLRVQLRFSSGPIYPHPNFQIVIRVLRMSVSAKKTLEEMGYKPKHARMMDNMLAGARGAVVLVGPTNSGKSTTLQALLERVFQRRGSTIKMITAEDPVEYLIPGAVQIGVPRKRKSMTEDAGSAFAAILKGALRQDPDVLMVGEMRDRESATLVKDAVLTGRKLFTTLHANSAVNAFVRLREIGVEWDVLTSPGFISGIIYQRLLPVLCPNCKIPLREGAYRLEADTLVRLEHVLNMMTDEVHVRGDGCDECNKTGHIGRTVCAEILTPDPSFLRLMAEGRILEAEQHWIRSALPTDKDGEYPTVLAHAISKMRAGLIDPKEIEQQVDLLTYDSVRAQEPLDPSGSSGLGARIRRMAAAEG